MRFFSKNTKISGFKLIVIVYIVGSILWGINQYGDKMDLSIFEIFKMQDIKDVVNMHFEERKPQEKRQLSEPIAEQKFIENKQALNQNDRVFLHNAVTFKGMASVTSGVTFRLLTPVAASWRKHITHNIHLYGVDTCAPRQKAKLNNQVWPCGVVTTAWLVTKTLGKHVSCRQAVVHNGIHYAQCFVDGVDLAQLGLAEGMMIVTKDQRNFPSPADYKSLQLVAQKAQKGLWSSEFQQPEDWRRDNGTYNPIDP
ncbi:hypothetical protein [Bartonella doshiae]|uniref:hypothetical protein n=1 Tax=Bartonella doshiae TaxID=33044 RepID=UPI001ABAFB46|nr:hypothetical protein [Bartonella doshiae]